MRLLLCHSLAHTAELAQGAVDLLPRLLTLAVFHLWCGHVQPPAGTVHNRQHHFQIAQQFRGWCRRRWRWRELLVGLQK